MFPPSVTIETGAQLNTPWESKDDAQTTVVFERDDDASVYYNEAPTYCSLRRSRGARGLGSSPSGRLSELEQSIVWLFDLSKQGSIIQCTYVLTNAKIISFGFRI